jgi:hypothetical protein
MMTVVVKYTKVSQQRLFVGSLLNCVIASFIASLKIG